MSAISIALQFVDLFLPFRILALVVLVLTAVIGALAIWQWYAGDRELRQHFQQERQKTEREILDVRMPYLSTFEAHRAAKRREQEE